jgi:hypothetical protein
MSGKVVFGVCRSMVGLFGCVELGIKAAVALREGR